MKQLAAAAPSLHRDNSQSVMQDIIIALIPVIFAACFFFGLRALTLTVIAVASSVAFEYACRRIFKMHGSIKDLSAVVTGMLLAYNLPVAIPLWGPVVGSFFAVVIVKQLLGRMGKTFVNPVLAARAFLLSWAGITTAYTWPFQYFPPFAVNADAAQSATPLFIKHQDMFDASIVDALIGNVGGALGETPSLLIIAGGLYLLLRRTITWHIPVSFIGTVAVIALLFPRLDGRIDSLFLEILTGGLTLGAFFMATDYATAPATSRGRLIFGIGCGLLTGFMRYFAGYSEGVCYSILIMNCCAWVIGRVRRPKQYEKAG